MRDRIIHRWLASERASNAKGRKRVYYLSLEFLIGRLLFDVLSNLRLRDVFRDALGRSRASTSTACGGRARRGARQRRPRTAGGLLHGEHGEPGDARLRLRHPLRPRPVRQVIKNGWQQEYAGGLAVVRQPVGVRTAGGGLRLRSRLRRDRSNMSAATAPLAVWHPDETVEAIAHDTPMVGWRGRHVNPLRLWSARATYPLRLERSTRATWSARHSSGHAPRRSRGCSIRATPRRPVRSCGFGRNISSRRLRCRTSFPGTRRRRPGNPAGPCRDPAQRHPPQHRRRRADATAARRARPALGRRVAHHRRRCLIPITRCCRRRSRAGRRRCSTAFCRATCRSSTGSTRCISTMR